MKKVLVIGCPGSGKSTFARALAEKTGLPLYHLDMMYWKSDRTTVDKSVFRACLAELLTQDAWIIDGNYGATMEMRLQACDTVFFLDLPTEICLAGVRARRGKPRADLPWIEPEGEQDEEFIKFIEDYRRDSRPKVLDLLGQYGDRTVVIFQSREDAEAYLTEIGSLPKRPKK